MFDAVAYAQALDKFIIQMEQIPYTDAPEVGQALEELCGILGVARIVVTLYENIGQEAEGKGDSRVLFDVGNVKENADYSEREQTEGGNIVVYYFFQKNNFPEWDESMLSKVQVLQKMLYTFQGRNRVRKVIENLTFYDQPLKTYNTNYVVRLMQTAIHTGTIGQYAACYFNLRRFSVVNQQLGRNLGTQVMRQFINQLQAKLTDKEAVGRIGGDNFIALFYKEHLSLVKSYLEGARVVYGEEQGDSVTVSAYTGYYQIPDDCNNVADIMDCINSAFHMAKNVHHITSVFYDEQLIQKQNDGKLIESMFPKAIEREEFLVYYQPKVLLKDYRLAGAEALCRWKHNGELVLPNQFIPILEESNAICTLDFYMLEHVCRDLRRWMDEGKQVVRVSVNFSRRHVLNPKLVESILEIVDWYEIPHKYIEIELTETTTDGDFTDLKKIASGLRNAGISTSVDDFGMGYSSLNLIREAPWNVLKIDRSFLPSGDQSDNQKYVMLKYLIAMFQDMGLECIVEGVETVEQVKLLKENNCYLAQGFYFDRPLPVEEFEKKLLTEK